MGIPVITGRTPAVAELLDEGTEIKCVEIGNATDLANEIRRTSVNYHEAIDIARCGQARFTKVASPSAVATELLKVMDNQLAHSQITNRNRQ